MDPEYLSFIPGQERQVYGQIISKKISQVQSSQVANGESAAVSWARLSTLQLDFIRFFVLSVPQP